MLGSFAKSRCKSGMKVVKQSASPEPGEVARRGKAAARRGRFPLIRLEFLKLLSTPQSSSLCSCTCQQKLDTEMRVLGLEKS